jgi:hypothetical protein
MFTSIRIEDNQIDIIRYFNGMGDIYCRIDEIMFIDHFSNILLLFIPIQE